MGYFALNISSNKHGIQHEPHIATQLARSFLPAKRARGLLWHRGGWNMATTVSPCTLPRTPPAYGRHHIIPMHCHSL